MAVAAVGGVPSRPPQEREEVNRRRPYEEPPPRRERDPDEFASVVIERPRAVMRRADAPKDKLAPRALTDLAPQRVTVGTTAAEAAKATVRTEIPRRMATISG